MVTMLEECTIEEQHSVVLLLWAKGLSAKDIHKEMFPIYGGKCLSHKAVHNWVEKFSQGCLKVTDDSRPGSPVEIATEETVQRKEKLI
jgi:transposase